MFQPYSSGLDSRARATILAAASFAKAHPLVPLSIAGYATRPDPGDVATLRQQRVAAAQDALIREGVDRFRIEVPGNGILYPDGVPDQPIGRVDINTRL